MNADFDDVAKLTTHTDIRIPGTTVTARLATWSLEPGVWAYSLRTDDDSAVASGTLDVSPMHGTETPEQVANVAYLLEVDWKGGVDAACQCRTRCPEDVTYCCSCGFRIKR